MPTAIVTGGSKGFGRALALQLADAGWSVMITGRTMSRLDEAVSSIPNAVGIAGDVADPAHRARLAESVATGLDLLVNNASTLGPSPLRGLSDIDVADLARVFDVNVVAPLALSRALLPSLTLGDGLVVNLSSDAAVGIYPGWGAYGASKSALDHAGAVFAAEHPQVSVYAFDPGDMQTDMHQAAFPGEDISDRPLPQSVVPALLHLLETRPASGRYVASDLLASLT